MWTNFFTPTWLYCLFCLEIRIIELGFITLSLVYSYLFWISVILKDKLHNCISVVMSFLENLLTANIFDIISTGLLLNWVHFTLYYILFPLRKFVPGGWSIEFFIVHFEICIYLCCTDIAIFFCCIKCVPIIIEIHKKLKKFHLSIPLVAVFFVEVWFRS